VGEEHVTAESVIHNAVKVAYAGSFGYFNSAADCESLRCFARVFGVQD